MNIRNDICLKTGDISMKKSLGRYYQDFTPAIVHFHEGKYIKFNEEEIPCFFVRNELIYSPVIVIQYGIICHDYIKMNIEVEENKTNFLRTMNWLDNNLKTIKSSYVFRNQYNESYDIATGWVSGMYQGQALSLYLRAYQLLEKPEYLNSAELIFKSFFITFEQGGFVRKDNFGNLWFEEYPSKEPSFVLNGFIYAMFGILDFYRVTKNPQALAIWEDCVTTLEKNIHKYDVWYWSLYDQLKEELVSYYYMKNVHIPLMEIMYLLTNKEIFNKFAKKWKKSLNNRFHKIVVQIMYRIRPRLLKIKSNAKCK